MRRFALALALTLAVLAGAASEEQASAAIFPVDSVADQAALGAANDGDCDANDLDPGADTCTLRAAVQEANGTPGADTIALPDLGADYLLVLGGTGEDLSAGGDLDVREELTIAGSGTPTVSGSGADRIVHVGPAATAPPVTLNGVRLAGGAGVSRGAGIYADSGTLTLSGVTVEGNTASDPGGGAQGGGIWLDPGGAHSMSATTVAGNTADGQAGAGGGGVAVASGASLSVTNSTISGNTVSSAGGSTVGGGIWSLGSVSLTHSTVHGNAATAGLVAAGGSIQSGGGSLTLRATIVSAGQGGTGSQNCDASGGSIASLGANLEAPGTSGASQCGLSAAASDRFAAAAGLAGLADRGGQTHTHAPLNGSPALDAIPSCFPLAADQRGLPRPGGTACEIGSFERQVLAPPGTGCFGKVPTIVGSSAGETILGTPGPDVILAQAGKDLIKGAGGKDRICAGKGNDKAFGAASGDQIAGDDGADRIFGQAGKDTLLGNAGRDFLDGGKARDLLNGGGRIDACRGTGDKLKDC